MTAEELIILIDAQQTRMPRCALQVLLRLVSKCILSGSNEVDISAAELARELDLSKDALKTARRALAGVVASSGSAGRPSVWVLPAEWFVVQRSLFAVPSAVENSSRRPGNQDIMAWKPGQAMDGKPGHEGLETRTYGRKTRPSWASFQAIKPLETRTSAPQDTENTDSEGLETRPFSIDRDRVLSSRVGNLAIRDSIEGANQIPAELAENAAKLKRWLRDYFLAHRPGETIPEGPDEVILAKCLAVAPLRHLAHVLKALDAKRTRPKDSWAWWVTVFCQRIHKTRVWAEVPALPGFHLAKKTPASEGVAQFGREILDLVGQGVRSMQ